MSEVTLASLAQFAVLAQSNTRKAVQDLSIEEARAKLVIADSNKTPAENGSQKLVVRLGKHNIPLDVIAPKATGILAEKDVVETFTNLLQEAINEGKFDEAIVAVQDKIREGIAKRKAAAEAKTETKAEGKQDATVKDEPSTDSDNAKSEVADTNSDASTSDVGDTDVVEEATVTEKKEVTQQEAADAAGFDMSMLDNL